MPSAAGELITVVYSYTTLPVTYAYDRLGRQTTVTQTGGSALTRTYNDAGQLLTETHTAGPLDGLAVTNGYDAYLRRTNLVLLNAAATLLHHTAYTYDSAGRLWAVTNKTASPMVSATYAYLANSPLVEQISFAEYASSQWQLRMTTTKAYDKLNRLTAIASVGTGATPSPISYAYQYNTANQRTRAKLADGSYWNYEYDALGQVKRGAKFFNDGYPVPGQQFEYAHDDIGNRQSTKAGGDENGAGLRAANYTVNLLNQYTSREVPGAFDVLGLALATNSTLTVHGSAPWRKGEYFRKEVAAANSSAAVWQSVSIAATGETTVSGHVFVPKTPEDFSYDDDGNLTQDGRWAYTWDAENRLVNMTSLSSGPSGSKLKLDFLYDAKWRRIQKLVSTNDGSGYVAQYTNRFVYDGWNLLATLNPQLSTLNTFLWGLDLSGSPQGAGGVGGLLAVYDASTLDNQPSTHFCAYDGNGNVAVLIKASDGTVSGNYEYGPFGEALRVTGTMAKANPFRFSSKYQDDETDLLYYGYRSYNASIGRWLSRDPIEEQGGGNIYQFMHNASIDGTEFLGLCRCKCKSVAGGPFGTTITAKLGVGELSVAIDVPWKVTFEDGSDWRRCHCRYIDDGRVSGTVKFSGTNPQNFGLDFDYKITDPIPCNFNNDRPGFKVTNPLPSGLLDYVFFRYKLNVTLECYDEGESTNPVSGTVMINAFLGRGNLPWP